MSRPLYSVGEEVLLCSKTYPELNGPAVVCEVVFKLIRGNIDGIMRPHGYFLNIAVPDGRKWCEEALRKKPDPGGEYSVEDIKRNIKVPVCSDGKR